MYPSEDRRTRLLVDPTHGTRLGSFGLWQCQGRNSWRRSYPEGQAGGPLVLQGRKPLSRPDDGEISHWGLALHQQDTYRLVLEEASHCGNRNLWVGIHRCQNCDTANHSTPRDIAVPQSPHPWRNIPVRRQPISCHQWVRTPSESCITT